MTDDEKLTELEGRLRADAPMLDSISDNARYIAGQLGIEPINVSDRMGDISRQAADAIHTLRQRNARLVEGLSNIATRLEALENYGDPYEIADDPEDFGGTDDGLETVCMAYENLQGSAAAIGRTARTLIEDNSNG